MQTTTQKIAMWIVDNIPCDKFAPVLFRYSIGTTQWQKYNKQQSKTKEIQNVYTIKNNRTKHSCSSRKI